MKYKLTDESISVKNKQLYRIKALKNFGDVKKGNTGGFIEKVGNLSQEGDCWIYDDSKIYGGSFVYDDARVFGDAHVFDNARVFGDAYVFDNAMVFGDTQVYENAVVFGNAQVYGGARIYGEAQVYGDAQIYGEAQVYGDAKIYGGDWAISPLYLRLSKHTMSFCSYTDIKIGCEINSIKEWKTTGNEKGKYYGYSNKEIAFYIETIKLAEKYLEIVKMKI